jgi:integrase
LELQIRQQKTGVELTIPVPDLEEIIAASPSGQLTFLVTEYGRPFSASGFGGWFKKQCRAASLPARCSAHALRKAAARRLAEKGCSALEIGAITGHATLHEIVRCTKAADQKRLARSAIEKMKRE